MSIVVTGGAGFIGSCMVRTLNDAGFTDIIIVDNIASTEKWKNLRNKKFTEYIHKSKFIDKIPGGYISCPPPRGVLFHDRSGF